MIDFTPTQRKTVAAGVSVLAFTLLFAFVAGVGWLLLKFLAFASPALMPVVIGLLLSMLLKPYFEFFRRRLRNPTLSLLALAASVLVPLGCVVWFGGAAVFHQVGGLVATIQSPNPPDALFRLSAWVNTRFPSAVEFLKTCGVKPDDLPQMFLCDPKGFWYELPRAISEACGPDAMHAGANLIRSVTRYLTSLGTLLVAAIFFVYFLLRPEMKGQDYVRELPFLKDETKGFVAKQIDAFFDILVSFFQRQVVICLLEGIYYGVGFMLVGLPYGFLIGFLLGVLNLVPLFGTVVCLPIAIPLAYFGDGGSALCLVLVLVVWLVGQFLDGYLITPQIQGNKTGLGYAGVIFSFFFWGVVFHSMLGLLLAIPLSAFCVVLWRALKEKYIKGVI